MVQLLWIYPNNTMDGKRCFLVVCLVTGYLFSKAQSLVELTNVKCETMDANFSDFEYCYLKSVNRTYKYLSLKVRLFKVPITKIKVNLALFKRLNGLKPFLYNLTFDGCKFLRNTNTNPVAKYFYEFGKEYSNMNHTCPYDHDLIVEKVSVQGLNYRVTQILPFPEGSYMFETNWYAYDIKRATVRLYLTLS